MRNHRTKVPRKPLRSGVSVDESGFSTTFQNNRLSRIDIARLADYPNPSGVQEQRKCCGGFHRGAPRLRRVFVQESRTPWQTLRSGLDSHHTLGVHKPKFSYGVNLRNPAAISRDADT